MVPCRRAGALREGHDPFFGRRRSNLSLACLCPWQASRIHQASQQSGSTCRKTLPGLALHANCFAELQQKLQSKRAPNACQHHAPNCYFVAYRKPHTLFLSNFVPTVCPKNRQGQISGHRNASHASRGERPCLQGVEEGAAPTSAHGVGLTWLRFTWWASRV